MNGLSLRTPTSAFFITVGWDVRAVDVNSSAPADQPCRLPLADDFTVKRNGLDILFDSRGIMYLS